MINFFSEAYTLKHYTTFNINIISSGELVIKTQYIICIQENTNLYWCKKNQQQYTIVTTQTIVHPCIDVVAVKYVHYIPISSCNINQPKKALQRHTICLT